MQELYLQVIYVQALGLVTYLDVPETVIFLNYDCSAS